MVFKRAPKRVEVGRSFKNNQSLTDSNWYTPPTSKGDYLLYYLEQQGRNEKVELGKGPSKPILFHRYPPKEFSIMRKRGSRVRRLKSHYTLYIRQSLSFKSYGASSSPPSHVCFRYQRSN